MLLDLHIHSRYSDDSASDIAQIIRTARNRGLDGIAICDHNSTEGSNEARLINQDRRFYVIPGVEYSTDRGHLLAYFFKLEPDLSQARVNELGLYHWKDVVGAVKAAGGLVFVAHPFKRSGKLPDELLDTVDGLECFNARVERGGRAGGNRLARETAVLRELGMSAGSDAHWLREVGQAFVEVPGTPGVTTLDEIREALRLGMVEVNGSGSSPYMEPFSQLAKAFRLRKYQRLPRILAKILWVTGQEAIRGLASLKPGG